MQKATNEVDNSVRMEKTLLTDLKDNLIHGISVSNLTYMTAREMELDGKTCYELAVAGLVHDIGKLRLSGYLYGRAQDSFAMENMKYMRLHSRISYDVLKDYDFSSFILQSVLHHHENYDGSGYPDNLKGEDIPFGARVMRAADTFTALISDRPYRKAFDIDTAMSIMIDEIHNYDMEVFIAFQKIIHKQEALDVITQGRLLIDYDITHFIGNEDNIWH